MSIDLRVRETLAVAGSVDVPPPPDPVTFRRLVRRERRRRTTTRLGVAAAIVTVAGTAVLGLDVSGTEQSGPAAPPPGPTVALAAVPLDRPAYAVRDGVLVALLPSGRVLDLGLPAEAVVGPLHDGVLAVDDDSHLARFLVRPAGRGRWSFARVAPPTAAPVQRA
ncbi:MAG: hypothetical protein HOQ45_08995, partial [Nocardioidaceae bacterium]|nr:hypothetical protein [Nocardioidaceae bacterium]